MTSSQPQNSLYIKRIVWFALLSSVCIYAAVAVNRAQAYGVQRPISDISLPNFSNSIELILSVVALAAFAVSLYLSKIKTQRPEQDFVIFVIRLAFTESVAVFGLILSFLQQDLSKIWIFIFLSLLGFIFAFPKKNSTANS